MRIEISILLIFAPLAAGAAWWLLYRARRGGLAAGSAALSAGLIVVALAGLFAGRPSGLRVFVVDVSGSMRGQTAEFGDRILAEAERLSSRDQVAVVALGATPQVVLPPTPTDRLPGSLPELTGDERGTDIAAAVELAAGLFPADGGGDIVLVTDGRATRGDTGLAAARLAARGIPVHLFRLEPHRDRDAWIETVRAPASVPRGQSAHVEVIAGANQPLAGRLELAVDGRTFATEEAIELPAGRRAFHFRVPAERLMSPGLRVISATIHSAGDTVPENNVASAAVRVRGELNVTYVAADGGRSVAGALDASDSIILRTVAPADLATTSEAVLDSDVVVLDNIAADALGGRRVRWIESFVADAAGGLVVLGGPDSYGPGGYAETPLADLLPVDPDPERRAARPTSVAIVADRSGSMAIKVGGRQRIEYVHEAVLRAQAEFGAAGGDRADELSVIQFHHLPETLVERRYAGTPEAAEAIRAALSDLFPQGDTRIDRALDAARDLLRQSDLRRHIILVSDGECRTELRADRLIEQMKADGVVLSVLATADSMDEPGLVELKAVTEATEGRFVLLHDIRDLPAAMARETRTVAGPLVREGEFAVARGPGTWPGEVAAPDRVTGYVITGARDEAPPILLADREPILAAWPRGLGRVAACTTSADEWAPGWAQSAPAFFEDLVVWAAGRERGEMVDARLTYSGGTVHIKAHAVADLGDADLIAVVRGPDGRRWEIALPQMGRHRYEGQLDTPAEGTYVASVRDAETGSLLGTGHVTIDVAEEWRPGGEPGAGTLLAGVTGGEIIADLTELPPPVRAAAARRATANLAYLLLAAAALGFVVSVIR